MHRRAAGAPGHKCRLLAESRHLVGQSISSAQAYAFRIMQRLVPVKPLHRKSPIFIFRHPGEATRFAFSLRSMPYHPYFSPIAGGLRFRRLIVMVYSPRQAER